MHSCYQAFTTCPLTGGEKDRREKARKESTLFRMNSATPLTLRRAEGQTEKTVDPSVYLMSEALMTEHAYPVPSPLPSPLPEKSATGFAAWRREDGWIEAPWQKKQAYGSKKVLGIDCEMVSTSLALLRAIPNASTVVLDGGWIGADASQCG